MQLSEFNSAPAAVLTPELLACCDVPVWAARVRDGRPYADISSLFAAADEAARSLSRADVDRALDAHPRIGERAHRDGAEAGWSRQEQSGVRPGADAALTLAEGNRAYEDRFGRIFLICASGLSGDEVLRSLHDRLGNDAPTEARVVHEELRKIAVLRLRRVLGS